MGECGIGVMAMPAGFQYREVFLKGKPRHEQYDSFSAQHPRMDAGKRAKIFAPFDALRGFDFSIMCKNELYIDKVALSSEETQELSRQLNILHNLTYNSRIAKENRVQVSVTYYVPCQDEDHEAYGHQGQKKTITGICWSVDSEVTHSIIIDNTTIPLNNVIKLEEI